MRTKVLIIDDEEYIYEGLKKEAHNRQIDLTYCSNIEDGVTAPKRIRQNYE